MTEGYRDFPFTDTETQRMPSIPPPTGGGDHDKPTDVAKEQAGELKQGAVEAGRQVASTAKDQAANVTAEAGRQASDLLDQARSELGQQASTQQQRVADGLRSLSSELHTMSRSSEQSGLGADLAHQGAQLTDQVASWFDGREPTALVEDVRSFARRRPGTFLLVAAGAGLLAGRLTRGLKDEASGSGGTQAGGSTTGRHGFDAPVSGGPVIGGRPAVGPVSDVPVAGGPIPTQGVPTQPATPLADDLLADPIPFAGDEGRLDYPGGDRR